MSKATRSGGWMAVLHEHLAVSSVAPLVASGLQYLTKPVNVEIFREMHETHIQHLFQQRPKKF